MMRDAMRGPFVSAIAFLLLLSSPVWAPIFLGVHLVSRWYAHLRGRVDDWL